MTCYRIPGHKALLERSVGSQDGCRHASGCGYGIEDGPLYLVKTFVDIRRPPRNVSTHARNVFVHHGGLVPAVLSPLSSHSCEHLRDRPLLDPTSEVPEPGAGPSAVECWEDEEDTVGEGVFLLLGVFGKECRLGDRELVGPGSPLFDEVKQVCKMLTGRLGEERKVGWCPRV